MFPGAQFANKDSSVTEFKDSYNQPLMCMYLTKTKVDSRKENNEKKVLGIYPNPLSSTVGRKN